MDSGKTCRGRKENWNNHQRGKRENHVFALGGGGSLNSLCEWPLVSLGRGHCLVGFLGGGVWIKATPRGDDLKWSLLLNIPKQMPGA